MFILERKRLRLVGVGTRGRPYWAIGMLGALVLAGCFGSQTVQQPAPVRYGAATSAGIAGEASTSRGSALPPPPQIAESQAGLPGTETVVPVVSVVGDGKGRKPWDSYFSAGTRENTGEFLQSLPPPPYDAQVTRDILAALATVEEEGLARLLSWQPENSPVIPFLKLALGERQLERGAVKEGLRLWQETAAPGEAASLIAKEAVQRTKPLVGAEFKIGLLLPLSGNNAALGRYLQQAAQQALLVYPDLPLSLVTEDSGDSADQSRKGLDQLREKGVRAVIGPIFHPQAKAVAQKAASLNLPLITLSPQADVVEFKREGDRRPPVFLNAYMPDQQARAIARYAVASNLRRVAIMAPESGYGDLTLQVFAQELRRLGGQVTQVVMFAPERPDWPAAIRSLYQPDTSGMAARLRKLQGATAPEAAAEAAAVTTDPAKTGTVEFDAVFLPARVDQVRAIATQLAAYQAEGEGVAKRKPVLLGTSVWNRPELLEKGGEVLEGAVFCDIDDGAKRRFRANYKQMWGEEPNPLAPLVYDGVAMLAQLVRDERLGGPSWREGLTRASGFRGAGGATVRLLENGHSQRLWRLYRVERQGLVLLPPIVGE